MKISIGSDHGGFSLKEELIVALKEKNIEIIDQGTYNLDSVDYPLFAEKVSKDVQSKTSDFGVLICTTGIGMCISANKFKGIRAALVNNLDSAVLTRQHNNSNIICLGAKYLNKKEAVELVEAFIQTKFDGGRHERRIEIIGKQEENK